MSSEKCVRMHVCVPNRSEWTCGGLCMGVFALVRVHLCVFSWFCFLFFFSDGVSSFSRTGLTLTWCFCSLEKCAAGAEALRDDRLGAARGHDERRHLLPPNANHENTYSPWNSRDDQENQDSQNFTDKQSLILSCDSDFACVTFGNT